MSYTPYTDHEYRDFEDIDAPTPCDTCTYDCSESGLCLALMEEMR